MLAVFVAVSITIYGKDSQRSRPTRDAGKPGMPLHPEPLLGILSAIAMLRHLKDSGATVPANPEVVTF